MEMAKRRVRKKPRKRRSAGAPASERVKVVLTMDQMLARVPEGKERLTTSDVKHIFGDIHQQTVYKMVGRGELRPFKLRNQGKASIYKTKDVIQAVHDRFQLVPGRRPTGDSNIDEDDPPGNGPTTSTSAQAKTRKKTKTRKKRSG